MDAEFKDLAQSCGIINYGIPHLVDCPTHYEDKCKDAECEECKFIDAYRVKLIREEIKFNALPDKNKRLYLNRYAIFKTKWEKVVRQCNESGDNEYYLHTGDDEGYNGYDSNGYDTEFVEFYKQPHYTIVSPFQCRKLYVSNMFSSLKQRIDRIKELITHLKQ